MSLRVGRERVQSVLNSKRSIHRLPHTSHTFIDLLCSGTPSTFVISKFNFNYAKLYKHSSFPDSCNSHMHAAHRTLLLLLSSASLPFAFAHATSKTSYRHYWCFWFRLSLRTPSRFFFASPDHLVQCRLHSDPLRGRRAGNSRPTSSSPNPSTAATPPPAPVSAMLSSFQHPSWRSTGSLLCRDGGDVPSPGRGGSRQSKGDVGRRIL
mmetsp:Transcript_18949/g.47327  ORF Transcript_18949/g.47327 Transcript_18949/m.47327 type:complete len:208 (-) Transcript_18949:3618-4241(-)